VNHARVLGAAGALLAVGLAVPFVLITTARGTASVVVGARGSTTCGASRVHYEHFPYPSPDVKTLPWVLAEPASIRLAGHLFYYDAHNPWAARHRSDWRTYTGGKSPDGRINMKVLWTASARVSNAPSMTVRGVRIGSAGRFAQVLAVGPSILKVPRPGCWRLTLKAGETRARLTVLAVRR
jgi:hypothetical protein